METVSAINFHDFTSSITGKASKVNQHRKVRVILAHELIQEYSKWELTDFLRKQIPEDVEFVKVFKPYSTIKDSIKGVKKLPISFGHLGIITTEDDWRIEGWVRQLTFDDENKSIKGWAYISTLHLTTDQLFLLDEGEPIAVSIGGTAIFGDGCNHCTPSYMFTQDKILLNHLAILWDGIGRCGIEHCGLNLDSIEETKKLQTGIHICGFNDEVKQPVFTLKRDVFNTNDIRYIDNTVNLKCENIMTEELKALRESFAKANAVLVADNEKLTIEKSAAIADAKNKCNVNKQLIKDNEDKDATIAGYEDNARKEYVKFFGDMKIKDPSEETIMKMDVDELKLKREWVETLLSDINDEKIVSGGLPKPGIKNRSNVNDKKRTIGSSIARDKKKEEEADK